MRVISLMTYSLLLILPSPVFAREFTKLSWPYITNYTKHIYNAENQNWSIDQDSTGNMYFGNNSGLLRFNGQSWELYTLPNHGIIRSLAVDRNGRIFIGSYEEFGYWENDEFGIMHYHSLKNLLDDYSFHNEEIWKIIIQANEVYFQAFSKIFVYNGRQVKIINPSGIISSFSKVENRLLIHITDKGLFEIMGNTLRLIDNSYLFKNNSLRAILPYKEDTYLVASYEKGIYIYSITDKTAKPWNPDLSVDLYEKKINRAVRLDNGKYIIGTILDGIYIFNAEGKFIQKIDQNNGLQNNTVLSLFMDRDNQLWVGLDTGIDRVHINSEISFFKGFRTSIGSVYTAIIHDDLIYVGTNRGLYASRLNINKMTGIAALNFQIIDKSQDQVWYLGSFDGELICGHNKGTFIVKNLDLEQISDVTGGFCMIKFYKDNKEYLLQSTYTNLVVYKRQENNWVFSHVVSGFQHPVRYIEIDHLNNIWAGHLLKGLYKLRLSDDLTRVVSTTYLGSKNGFKSDNEIKVCRFRNRVIFINEGNTYAYNDFTDRIVPFDLFRSSPKKERIVITKIIPVNDDYCWIITDQDLLYYRFTDSIPVLLGAYPFELFNGELIEKNEYILPLDSNRSIVCINEGLALISRHSNVFQYAGGHIYIEKVNSSGHRQMLLKKDQNSLKDIPVLPYNQNTLTFNFYYPQYSSEVTFRIKLTGLDTTWTETRSNSIKYERLPYNSYTFEVLAVNESGQRSNTRKWSFVIRPPIYLSLWAYMVYVLLFLGLLYFMSKYYGKRMKIQELNLREEKENALIKMRNERLRSEIQQKTEQLADTTFAIIKKNDLLMRIKRLLMNNRKYQGNLDKQVNETIRIVERNISHGDDWKIFENNFEQAHREFLGRLKESCPGLSPSDLRLCAFLRMNLSSKKIGSLLGISTRSVENHRYRIRKKLNLEHDSNLTEFIMGF